MYARLGAIATNPTVFQRVAAAPSRSCTSIGCVTCTPNACSGTGTWFGVFSQLQQLANAAAATIGLSQRVNVDGTIRQDTADLVAKLGAQWAGGAHVMIFEKISPRYVADHAQAIINRLTQIAGVPPGGGGGVFRTNPGPFNPLPVTPPDSTTSSGGTDSGGPPTSSDGALLPAGPSVTVTAPVTATTPGILQTIGDAPLGYKLAAGAAVLAAVAVGASLFRRHHKT